MAVNIAPNWTTSRSIVGYRPAPQGSKDWAGEDLWIGPFPTPNNESILGFRRSSDGRRLLLSTDRHVMLLDEEQLLEEAKKRGAARSTLQWRREYDARLAKTGWQSLVPALILDKKYDEALRLLDARKAELPAEAGKLVEHIAVDLWRARVLSEAPGRMDEAIAAYDALATGERDRGATEAFARANQVVLLQRAGKWQELSSLAQRVWTRFPQMRASAGGPGLDGYIAEARKKLASATQPASRPAVDTAIAPAP
jgi:hypothetical protein